MRIGIFGGSFNPPHKGHYKIATNLIKNGYVDRVIFVPTGKEYPKDDLVEDKHRLKMLKIMTSQDSKLDVSDFEQKAERVYTYQTLDFFQKKYPKDNIYFICGSDNLEYFTTWKNWEYILTNYKLLVHIRRIFSYPQDLEKYKKNVIFLQRRYNVSSTVIRELLRDKKDRKCLTRFLDPNVLKYIERKHLYERNKVSFGRRVLTTLQSQ